MATSAAQHSRSVRTTLFVANLPDGVPSEAVQAALERAFARYEDDLLECVILTHSETGKSRGFGFVRMRTPGAAAASKNDIDGTHLHISFAGAPPVPAKLPLKIRWALSTATLYVGDLSPSVNDATLCEAFRQFGNVISCRIEYEPTELGGASKRHGFVEYSTSTVAANVQQLLSENLFILGSSPRPLRVEFAVDGSNDDGDGRSVGPALNGQPLCDPPPHFAQPGSLEFEFALKWRELALAHEVECERLREVHRQEREILRQEQKRTYQAECAKLLALENGANPVQDRGEWGQSQAMGAGAKRPRS